MPHSFHLISLGCAKNLVDSEQMLAALLAAGYEHKEDPAEAEMILINTCAFIEDAKREAIDEILEAAQYKNSGALVALIVAGCLAERYREEVTREIPEIDALVGCGSFGRIAEIAGELLSRAAERREERVLRFDPLDGPLCEAPRELSTPFYTAYLKIAEGCDNRCSYCVIPSIRGLFRSRETDAIVAEAQGLAKSGVRELILVAQDLTRYGLDLYGERCLAPLLRRLDNIEGIKWIRLLYLYPSDITDELLDEIAGSEKILKYIDMPIQHCADRVLAAMNRRYAKRDLAALLKRIREKLPDAVLRTSLITGFPGETEEDAAELLRFISRSGFRRIGIFPYSQEEGTAAAELEGQISDEVKAARHGQLLDAAERAMSRYNRSRIGTTAEVLCEGYDRLAGCYFGRSFAEAPDVDGKIFFLPPSENAAANPSPGDFVRVRLTEDLDGDLLGELTMDN